MPVPSPQHNRVRRSFGRAATDFAAHDFLYREIARRMAERLSLLRIAPKRLLDAGCGLGADRLILQQHYPDADWLGLDFSLPMLRHGLATERAAGGFLRRLFNPGQRAYSARLAANLDALPLVGDSIDLIWSNAALHWASDVADVFGEFNRVLAVGGLLMFSAFGPDTLKELRQATRAVAADAPARVMNFTDMHDLGDLLVDTGFVDPVLDMETLTLVYADPMRLLHELRGAGSIMPVAMPRGLTTQRNWQKVFEHWPEDGKDSTGRYRLTFELVQGHAWKTAPRSLPDGRSVINFMPRP